MQALRAVLGPQETRFTVVGFGGNVGEAVWNRDQRTAIAGLFLREPQNPAR